jgi:hypothetical protein
VFFSFADPMMGDDHNTERPLQHYQPETGGACL